MHNHNATFLRKVEQVDVKGGDTEHLAGKDADFAVTDEQNTWESQETWFDVQIVKHYLKYNVFDIVFTLDTNVSWDNDQNRLSVKSSYQDKVLSTLVGDPAFERENHDAWTNCLKFRPGSSRPSRTSTCLSSTVRGGIIHPGAAMLSFWWVACSLRRRLRSRAGEMLALLLPFVDACSLVLSPSRSLSRSLPTSLSPSLCHSEGVLSLSLSLSIYLSLYRSLSVEGAIAQPADGAQRVHQTYELHYINTLILRRQCFKSSLQCKRGNRR